MKPYFRLMDVATDVIELRINGIERGKDCGIYSLNEFFSLKKGFPLFVAGAPFSGKTEFVLDVLLNTSLLYGWKHFIYVGEGGDVQNVFGELIHKHAEKPFVKENPYSSDDKQFSESMAFIQKHFVIANHDKEFTVSDFYATVLEAEEELKIKFDTTLFDPFNDIKDETEVFGGREDKYLASALKMVRIDAKRHGRINILVNHIADVKMITDREGRRFMPPAAPNEWAGGRTWWRRAFTMILVYRPPFWMKDDAGMPYAENESHIYIQKSKPKGIGKVGMGKIFWDWKKNRYYCFAPGGQQLYSCQTPETEKEYIQTITQQNDTFFPANHYNDDNPF